MKKLPSVFFRLTMKHQKHRQYKRRTELMMEELEQIIGYTFQNRKLLKQALTHSSYANEKKLGKLGLQ